MHFPAYEHVESFVKPNREQPAEVIRILKKDVQYPGGTIIGKLYVPNFQDWRGVLGAAIAAMPRCYGAKSYRKTQGTVIFGRASE